MIEMCANYSTTEHPKFRPKCKAMLTGVSLACHSVRLTCSKYCPSDMLSAYHFRKLDLFIVAKYGSWEEYTKAKIDEVRKHFTS